MRLLSRKSAKPKPDPEGPITTGRLRGKKGTDYKLSVPPAPRHSKEGGTVFASDYARKSKDWKNITSELHRRMEAYEQQNSLYAVSGGSFNGGFEVSQKPQKTLTEKARLHGDLNTNESIVSRKKNGTGGKSIGRRRVPPTTHAVPQPSGSWAEERPKAKPESRIVQVRVQKMVPRDPMGSSPQRNSLRAGTMAASIHGQSSVSLSRSPGYTDARQAPQAFSRVRNVDAEQFLDLEQPLTSVTTTPVVTEDSSVAVEQTDPVPRAPGAPTWNALSCGAAHPNVPLESEEEKQVRHQKWLDCALQAIQAAKQAETLSTQDSTDAEESDDDSSEEADGRSISSIDLLLSCIGNCGEPDLGEPLPVPASEKQALKLHKSARSPRGYASPRNKSRRKRQSRANRS